MEGSCLLYDDQLKKDTNFVWNTSHSTVFESLKVALSSAAILHHPSPGARLALSVDASDKGLGAVLEQFSIDQWCPLAFFSRALNPAQLKYSAFDRELLAVKEAIRHFRHFLEGENFTVFTDHRPLTTAIHSRNPTWSPRQHRHFAEISEMTTDLQHISGKNNVVADALSRVFTITNQLIDWSTVCNGSVNRSEYTVICNSHHRPEDRPCHGCRSLYCLRYLIRTATSVSSGNMGPDRFRSYTQPFSPRSQGIRAPRPSSLCVA